MDATLSSCIGCFMNDEPRKPNCKVVLRGENLCVYTIRDINTGEELRYDYKGKNAFWRKVYLFHNNTHFSQGHYLQQDEVFPVGTQLFKWQTPIEQEKVQKLSDKQSSLLKMLFKSNVDLRRVLQREDCEKVINKYEILSQLSWQKVKNVVHNWITLEKKRMLKKSAKIM